MSGKTTKWSLSLVAVQGDSTIKNNNTPSPLPPRPPSPLPLLSLSTAASCRPSRHSPTLPEVPGVVRCTLPLCRSLQVVDRHLSQRPTRKKRLLPVNANTILRLHRIARITLSSEIIFNVWSIVLSDFVDHNIQPFLVKHADRSKENVTYYN